jgi:protease-4
MGESPPAPKGRSRKALILVGALTVVCVAIAFLIKDDSDKAEQETAFGDIFASGNRIGVAPIEGPIDKSDKILKQLRKYQKARRIKAIVLRINSPGGAVAPAQEIYREVRRISETKPVVASIETVGASAAYYIASGANRIVCSPGSITGSIGVIMVMTQVREVIDRLGLKVEIIKAGKYKDIGSFVRPMTPEERQILEDFAKEIHERFIQDVHEGRRGKISLDQLRDAATGGFCTGEKALQLGLVDEMGNFYDAVARAAELGRIKGDPELVYPKKRWDGYLDMFMDSGANALVKALDKARLLGDAPSVR